MMVVEFGSWAGDEGLGLIFVGEEAGEWGVSSSSSL